MLLDDSGQPIFEVTVYALTMLRGRNLASNTIEQALRAIFVLYLFLNSHQIGLSTRFRQGYLLSLTEIDALINFCRLSMKDMYIYSPQGPYNVSGKVASLKVARGSLSRIHYLRVVPTFTATRLIYIREYLNWAVQEYIFRSGAQGEPKRILLQMSEELGKQIAARLPKTDRRGTITEREGLEPELIDFLFTVLDAGDERNPWQSSHNQKRNKLIIYWLYHLGIRRGELLNVRIQDINFHKGGHGGGTVIIARRADDMHDPRLNQPLVKTKARELPVHAQLLEETEEYMRVPLPRDRFYRRCLGEPAAQVLTAVTTFWAISFASLNDREKSSRCSKARSRLDLLLYLRGKKELCHWT